MLQHWLANLPENATASNLQLSFRALIVLKPTTFTYTQETLHKGSFPSSVPGVPRINPIAARTAPPDRSVEAAQSHLPQLL
jgi:hypothetical protein